MLLHNLRFLFAHGLEKMCNYMNNVAERNWYYNAMLPILMPMFE